MQSRDVAISDKLGLDNNLALRHRSISFWSITLVTVPVVLIQVRHYHTLFGFLFPLCLAGIGWTSMCLGQIKLARLAISNPEMRESLTRISAYLAGAATAVMVACATGRF
jgi:hypothetical protein